jgi:hypothetical protein
MGNSRVDDILSDVDILSWDPIISEPQKERRIFSDGVHIWERHVCTITILPEMMASWENRIRMTIKRQTG